MATSRLSEALRRLHDGPSDGQLLEDYRNRRDAAALAALVRRHGPMVWGVCRRVLRDHHDAEDAFQATFLVLVRKASSVASPELLANWLYGTAYRTARDVRATVARRRARERPAAEMPEPAAADRDPTTDLQPILDDELSRLPERYRGVIVLCALEGKTRKEAARRLGVPEGTVGGWLARARALLAKRLARRGLVLSGAAATLLAGNGASAGVPPAVVASTIEAAGRLAAGAIPVGVAASAGGPKTMWTTKLTIATAVLFAAGTVALTYGVFAGQPQPPGPADEAKARPPAKAADAPKTDEDRLRGTWLLVVAETDGLRIGTGRPEIKDNRMVFEKGTVTLYYTTRSPLTDPEAKTAVAEFALDAGRTPRVMTLKWKEAPWNGKADYTQKAIYALDGDTLKLCLSMEDEKAPPEFSADYGSKRLLWTFKREPAAEQGSEKKP